MLVELVEARFSRALLDSQYVVLPRRFKADGAVSMRWEGSKDRSEAWVNRFWWQYFELRDACFELRDVVSGDVTVGGEYGSHVAARHLRRCIDGGCSQVILRFRDLERCVLRASADGVEVPSELNTKALRDVPFGFSSSNRLVASLSDFQDTLNSWRYMYRMLATDDLRGCLDSRRPMFLSFLSGRIANRLMPELFRAGELLFEATQAEVESRRGVLSRSKELLEKKEALRESLKTPTPPPGGWSGTPEPPTPPTPPSPPSD